MASEQGYSNQKKKGKAQFKTIHPVNSDGFAEGVILKYLARVDALTQTIMSITDVLGNNGQVELWEIDFGQEHHASVGDVMRVTQPGFSPELFNFEYDIQAIVTDEIIRVLPTSTSIPAQLDSVQIFRYVTGVADVYGNPQISLAPSAVKFNLNGSLTDVSEDTVNPNNSVPLPVKEMGNLSNLVDNVAIGDGGGNIIGSVESNAHLIRSLAVFDDDNNAVLNQLNEKIIDNGVVDYDNSWATPLLANGVFYGLAFDITDYAAINVCVFADVASATNGVKVEYSIDGTNWDHSHSTTYAGSTGAGYIFNCEFRYARVVYTNGPVAQTAFRLQTIFKVNAVKQSLYTISQAVNGNMFAELGKNVIIGETTGGGGGYVAVKVNPSGALTTESTVTGTVSVSNFPATQPVSGSVSVSNFPATQAVTGTFWQATQPVSGSVSVSNFPATQAVTGTFWQATQPVSGSVSVSNFPATQNTQEQSQSGTITSVQKAVGLTAVRATVSGSAPSATRKRLILKPSKNNSGAIYLGSSSVTTSSGLEIIGPDTKEFLLDASDYYLISDTAGQSVDILEVV